MRMQLYKMELYKIFHRKIFWIGILAILGLMFVYFWFAEVGDERCVIDGRSHSGYEAVQMKKKLQKSMRVLSQMKKSIRLSINMDFLRN